MEITTGRWRIGCAVVLGVALVVRLAYFGGLHRSILFERPQGDDLLHFELAREISSGHWLGDKIFYYAPLYPYFVALIFATAGISIPAVALVQVGLSVIDVGLIMLLAERVFGRRAGLLAGLMAAFYGPFVFYTGFLLKETLGLVLLDPNGDDF